MTTRTERPSTSKPRGVCQYYTTPRGCFAGSTCKFLHGETESFTPYDKGKTCKFYAAGYCRRGAQCWFVHSQSEASSSGSGGVVEVAEMVQPKSSDDEEQLCSICYEKPVTYGLLAGCSHVYCVHCIREWRDPNGKSSDVVVSGVTKKCPLCRCSSKFVTPSSHFYPDGHPGKDSTIEQYKASMARIPCRYFLKSPSHDRFCPFGRDCFYQHLNDDGTPYEFEGGVDHYMKLRQRRRNRSTFGPSSFAMYDDDDDDESPWVQDLSAAIEAIRATLPAFLQRATEEESPSEDVSGDESDEAATEHSGPQPPEEVMNRLAEPDEPFARFLWDALETLDWEQRESERPLYRFGSITPALQPLHTSANQEQRIVISEPGSPVLPYDLVSNDFIPDGAATPLPLPSSSSQASTGTNTESNSRFSTVVHQRSSTGEHFRNPEETIVSIFGDRFRALSSPDHRLSVATNEEQASHTAPTDDTNEDATGPSLSVEFGVSSPIISASILSPELPFHRPPSPLPLLQTEGERRPELRSVSESEIHEADPPLLTDGRGRVVWSSTAAARRRARAASSAVKSRLRDVDMTSSAEGQGLGQTSGQPFAQVRSSNFVRARSLPERSETDSSALQGLTND